MTALQRSLALSLLTVGIATAAQAAPAAAAAPTQQAAAQRQSSSYITTADGVQLYYKDWGPKNGPVVAFSHGWPLNSDSWESQMLFLADHGYRV
ncbi:alpha/beta fold hydrolase, partial [Lysobacter sp. 2RAB21]